MRERGHQAAAPRPAADTAAVVVVAAAVDAVAAGSRFCACDAGE